MVPVFVLLAAASSLTEFHVHREGQTVAISPAKASATVLVFASTLCPVSDKYVERLNELYRVFSNRNVQFVLANPNANETWADVKRYTDQNGVEAPAYKDENNVLADRVGARSTPEAFVFDRSGQLRYRGHIDDSVNPTRVRSRSLHDAIEAVVSGGTVANVETPARGCAIHRFKK